MRMTAQYLSGSVGWEIDDRGLAAAEEQLVRDIAAMAAVLSRRPAEARVGTACRWCPVRARCEPGWSSMTTVGVGDHGGDVEVVIVGVPTATGFLAARSGNEVFVVHDASILALLPQLEVGQRLRLVDAAIRDRGAAIELKPWTEVYLVTGTVN